MKKLLKVDQALEKLKKTEHENKSSIQSQAEPLIQDPLIF
jgi:hypothetical protein